MSANIGRHAGIAQARSLLFVPGNRPERFEKAARGGADAVILDLEDSVPPQDKAAARLAIAAQWPGLCAVNVPLVVRINSESADAWSDDLALLARLSSLAAVMVPKAEGAHTVGRVREALPGVPIIPLIETAAGWLNVNAVAQTPGVLRLAIGHIDFMADTGITCGADEAELAPLRFAVAMATRLANLPTAIDGVTVQTQDLERLTADTQRARRFGFGGKLCIHPNQIVPVHEAFAPTEQELAWARRVIEADAASQGAAVQLDGRMVDAPVVLAAKRVVMSAARG